MKRNDLVVAILGGLVMAAAISGCSPDNKDAAPTAAEPMNAEPAQTETPPPAPPMESAPESMPTATATATLKAADGSKVSGELMFAPNSAGIHVTGTINGLKAGAKQGFHIHETGDCSAPDFKSAGGHFNPDGKDHGNPDSAMHHAGDMMNLAASETGTASVDTIVPGLTLGDGGDHDAMNRAIVIHAGADDYTSQPAGDSGDRVACGVIEKQG
ncbi:MAG: superoxide dismutase family protein [Dokdonella sp.]